MRAYVVKQDRSAELLRTLKEVQRGQTHISPTSLHPDAARKGALELSVRQRQVVQLPAQGKSVKSIAETLHLSVMAVEHQAD